MGVPALRDPLPLQRSVKKNMASRAGEVFEPPEIGASRFYSKKAPKGNGTPTVLATTGVEQNGEANSGTTGQHVQPKPLGIVQALDMDRAGRFRSPHHFRRSYLKEHLSDCDAMYSCDIVGHHGCVNALAFSRGEQQFLGTGTAATH